MESHRIVVDVSGSIQQPDTIIYDSKAFVSTQSGNLVWNTCVQSPIDPRTTLAQISRESVLYGSQNIVIAGKSAIMPGVVLHGNLASVRLGRHCYLGRASVFKPADKKGGGPGTRIPIPMTIGDHVVVLENCVVEAASIGSYVVIEKGAHVGPRCILKDCCRIRAGAEVAPDTVVPPFCEYGGDPASLVSHLPDCTQRLVKEQSVAILESFKAS